jgi:hypothetical protein
MATVSITSWRDDGTTWSGWAGHARSEFTRRLRSSVNQSRAARRNFERQVKARQLAVIQGVDLSQAERLRHILEALGANVAVDPAGDAS